jgi:shikimate 5-dehydrogenase
MAHRSVCGLLGPRCIAGERKRWNALFREEGIDAFFDCYKASSVSDLELRLAEMFHLERRGYLVVPSLQVLIIPLLDQLDVSVAGEGRVDTVVNNGGVLCGYCMGDWNDQEVTKRILEVWF